MLWPLATFSGLGGLIFWPVAILRDSPGELGEPSGVATEICRVWEPERIRHESFGAPMTSYKKLQKLGSGAFATTFLVEEVTKGSASVDAAKKAKQLVMKRVPCKHMRAANAALQEVKVLLSCHHPGITGYHDFFLDTDSDDNIVICLVMEFCDGGDLWEKIANARRSHLLLDPSLVAGYTLQLVAALRYLHARSILHRDIKPENVFLTDEGRVAKLGDFGLATATEDLGAAKTQVGTPDYMAPEVLEGRPYSEPADVFSLGATVYAMVCSSFPKMLAMHLGQGKPLDWPAAAAKMPTWKPVIEAMLAVEVRICRAPERPYLECACVPLLEILSRP